MLAIADLPDPTFDEASAIVEARALARRLAVSDLPIVIEGEPGTGRRTLAMSVVRQRSNQSGRPTALLDAAEGIGRELHDVVSAGETKPVEVLLHNLESTDKRHLAELGSLVRAKQSAWFA